MPKKKTDTRTIEELHDIAPEKMTDKEKNSYIKAAREHVHFLQQTNDTLDQQVKQRFEDNRIRNQEFEQYRNKTKGRMGYLLKLISTMHDAAMLGARMEDF